MIGLRNQFTITIFVVVYSLFLIACYHVIGFAHILSGIIWFLIFLLLFAIIYYCSLFVRVVFVQIDRLESVVPASPV